MHCKIKIWIVDEIWDLISSVENQKGINYAVQWCSIENQKGAINAIHFVWQ